MNKRLSHIRNAQIYSDLAKEYTGLSAELYKEKENQILLALKYSNDQKAYVDIIQDIIYFETEIGQISFHLSTTIKHKNVIEVEAYLWDSSIRCSHAICQIDKGYYINKSAAIINKF